MKSLKNWQIGQGVQNLLIYLENFGVIVDLIKIWKIDRSDKGLRINWAIWVREFQCYCRFENFEKLTNRTFLHFLHFTIKLTVSFIQNFFWQIGLFSISPLYHKDLLYSIFLTDRTFLHFSTLPQRLTFYYIQNFWQIGILSILSTSPPKPFHTILNFFYFFSNNLNKHSKGNKHIINILIPKYGNGIKTMNAKIFA